MTVLAHLRELQALHRTSLSSLAGILLTFGLSLGESSAALSAAPPGFTWQLVSTETYTAEDSFLVDIGADQVLAPAGQSVGTSFTDSLSATTFNAAAVETGLGPDYGI